MEEALKSSHEVAKGKRRITKSFARTKCGYNNGNLASTQTISRSSTFHPRDHDGTSSTSLHGAGNGSIFDSG